MTEFPFYTRKMQHLYRVRALVFFDGRTNITRNKMNLQDSPPSPHRRPPPLAHGSTARTAQP